MPHGKDGSIANSPGRSGESSLAYRNGRPGAVRHLLISEALQALLRHAFDDMKLHRIEADVDPHNAASLTTLERLGFQREGHLRERWIVDGEITDTVFYGLLAREWRQADVS